MATVALATLVAATALAGTGTPGPQGDGTGITPQGWRVTPAGRQTDLVGNPLAVAVSPSGGPVLVGNGGYNQHDLAVVDPASGDVQQTIKAGGGNSGGPWQLEEGHAHGYYVGLAFSPDGRSAYASDGPGSSLHFLSIAGQAVTELQRIKLTSNVGNQGAYPAGIAVSADGSRLYVAGNLDNTLFVVNPVSRRVTARIAVGSLPYGVALNRNGTLAFVTNWGGRCGPCSKQGG